MARLSNAFLTAIRLPNIYLAHFAQFDFRSGTIRFWTGKGSITWGGETWLGAGNLATIDKISESTRIEAPAYQFGLLGIDPSLLALASEQQYRNRSCQMWMAVMDSTFSTVTAAVRVFGGVMSHMLISDQAVSGSLSIVAENELARLNTPNEVRYTDEHQRAIFPGDTGLRYIAATSDTPVYWGRYQDFGPEVTKRDAGRTRPVVSQTVNRP